VAEKRGVLFTGLGLVLIWEAFFEVWPGSAEYRLTRNFTHTRMDQICPGIGCHLEAFVR